MNFKNKNIVISGASGDIGSILAKTLYEKGANITAITHNKTTNYNNINSDLSTVKGINKVCEQLKNIPVDILINLAGTSYFGPFEKNPNNQVEKMININLLAPILLTQAVIKTMKKQNSGNIVNIGSIFASINFAYFAHYSGSKAGLKGFSEAISRELQSTGVFVNYIALRAVNTKFNNQYVLTYAKRTKMKMDSPNYVVNKIIKSINKNKKNTFVGIFEHIAIYINAIFPSFITVILKKNNNIANMIFKNKKGE
ncbi:Oxidoreductase, short-chain dehydrogenase/reductase family [hydrothermal vent metagenome]|uniref:Oxidoreductase, short-chain dehydrogenase/reductase family n=1 Tax=hydrothermal vent metagenome TaxID=652676 RepID=A0A1W1CRL7_9ZZZZ